MSAPVEKGSVAQEKLSHCYELPYCRKTGPYPCACGCGSCLFVRSHEEWPDPARFLDVSVVQSWKKLREREHTHITAYGRTSVWPEDVNDVTAYLRAHGFTFDVVQRKDPMQGFWEIHVVGWANPCASTG